MADCDSMRVIGHQAVANLTARRTCAESDTVLAASLLPGCVAFVVRSTRRSLELEYVIQTVQKDTLLNLEGSSHYELSVVVTHRVPSVVARHLLAWLSQHAWDV
jgi:hypothetical protein